MIGGIGWFFGGPSAGLVCFAIGSILIVIGLTKGASPRWRRAMFDTVEKIYRALGIESTLAFVLIIAFGSALTFGILGAAIAWIVDADYKHSPEYKAHHSPKQQTVTATASQSVTVAAQQGTQISTKSKVRKKIDNGRISIATPPSTYQRATFTDLTAISEAGGTALLDCDPLATFNRVMAKTNSQTEPAVDVGSSKCTNQESFAEYAAYRQLKAGIARDAGNRELVKSDLETLKAKLVELREPEHEQRPKEYWDKLDQNFDDTEAAFLSVADDKEKTLQLLSRLVINNR